MLKFLIIDDDLHCRNILKGMLESEFPGIIEMGYMARSVEEGLSINETVRPNLVFLDVELGDGTGFDFLEKATYSNFKLIFTTAHASYALQAFKVNATDYLLKPFSPSELRNAVNKALEQPDFSKMGMEIQLLLEYMSGNRSKIGLPTQNGFEFVMVQDIIRCEAQGNYTKFILKEGKTHLVSKTMKIYEKLLENDGFCRVHASHLINMKEIRTYRKGEGGEVVMTDGSSVEISRSKREDFLSRLRY